MSDSTQSSRRWYDQDPLLAEVLELLRAYPADLKAQAEIFLAKIEEQIGKETLEQFYELSKPTKTGNRWYDHDPVVSKAIELLRVVPPQVQRQAAERFLASMKKQGLTPELLKSNQTP
ncbi:MAG TPA: hypothetical protein V6C99_01635 [Oculatellaceae cyanobacterium]|jgi:cell division protein FtsI/penicillin-binding protein 2